jgi:cell division protein FtsL
MSGGVKLRRLAAWMVVMACVAVLALGHVWKQNVHVGLSRDLVKTSRERDVLAAEVLLLETETRGLRHYSRLETVARERLGLVNPGPPLVIQPAGQIVAANETSKDTIRSARWKGFFR